MSKFNYLIFIGGSFLFFPYKTFGTPPQFPTSENFSFQGKPIEPACIDHFHGNATRFQPLDLKTDQCQKVHKPYNSQELKNGFIGYESLFEGSSGSYLYYQYLGKIHFENLKQPAYHLIFVKWSGGGSGQFTQIQVIEKNDNSLRLIETLDTGDRAMGGLSNVELKDGVLSYDKEVTPLGLLNISQKQPIEKTDLLDCMSCRLGYVHYKGGEVTDFKVDKEYRLEENPKNLQQTCYNKIFKTYITPQKASMSLQEIKEFGQKVKPRCLNP